MSDAVTFKTLEAAYWEWLKTNCPVPSGPQRKAWLAQNPFVHDGVTYHREAQPMLSNSRKSIQAWRVRYFGGGVVIDNENHLILNRANDPNRNWGLGRD